MYRISNNNGVFDNVTENNLVDSFDTKSLGVTNPEGIVFDSTNDSLFIAGHHEQAIIQTTTYGILLRTIDISAINADKPSGLALAPSSEVPTTTNLYMVARGVDNNSDPNENDGAIYELEIPTNLTPLNNMPVVSTGENQSIILPVTAQLSGSISDDGKPNGSLIATWSKQSGPGQVSFTDPHNLNTEVSFSMAGTYVLRLTGYDGDLYSFDDLSIVVTSHIPVIILNGTNPMNLNLGETFSDPGATAMDDADGDLTAFIQSTSNVDTSNVGIYQVTYTVTDSDGYSASVNRRVVVSDGIFSLQSRVSASTDDAEERLDGRMYLTSSDLNLAADKQLQTIGVRFSDLPIPTTAIITKVYIQFQADETDFLLDTQLNIVAESTDNTPVFTDTDYNISSRNKTNASVSWAPAAWSTIGEAGEAQRTPDLSAIVQEIVSETGWQSGNAIAFIFTGTGTRTAEAYDGEQAAAPLLYLEYTTDSSIITPVITLLGDNPLTVNLNDTFTDPGANAQDDADGDISDAIVISGAVDTNTAGTYLLTYSVTDSDGNSASVTREVIVHGNTVPPVITVLGDNPLTVNLNDTFTDPGATARDDIDGDVTSEIVISGTVDTNTAGSYVLTYSVTDSDGNSASATRNVIVSDGTSEVIVLQSRVSAGANDAKERINGKVYLGSTDLEMAFDNNSLQTIGVRFIDLSMPANAIIHKAYIQFQSDEIDTLSDIQLNIVAQSTSNAPEFTTADYNISSRTNTNVSVSWSPAAWSIIGEAGENQRTPDLSAIVQEIISETGWNSGNAMVFIFTGTGRRVAESYNGDRAGAPLLYVEYSSE
ncbi:DUF5011 domain-containing protein [Psychromonas sp.]|uniref:DUF5011 domain-containing protein n=1 Tax=Psychromonas sp. TaxID=1884585 RepID=UPI003565CC3D